MLSELEAEAQARAAHLLLRMALRLDGPGALICLHASEHLVGWRPATTESAVAQWWNA